MGVWTTEWYVPATYCSCTLMQSLVFGVWCLVCVLLGLCCLWQPLHPSLPLGCNTKLSRCTTHACIHHCPRVLLCISRRATASPTAANQLLLILTVLALLSSGYCARPLRPAPVVIAGGSPIAAAAGAGAEIEPRHVPLLSVPASLPVRGAGVPTPAGDVRAPIQFADKPPTRQTTLRLLNSTSHYTHPTTACPPATTSHPANPQPSSARPSLQPACARPPILPPFY